MIPFVYSHLVSAGAFLYLLGFAVVKAANCTPEATWFSGLVLPLLSFLISLATTVGLIEIGQAIANPWGIDPEDFAVPKFLQVTAKASRLLVELEQDDPLGEGEQDIGNPDLSNVHSECGTSYRDSHADSAHPLSISHSLPSIHSMHLPHLPRISVRNFGGGRNSHRSRATGDDND